MTYLFISHDLALVDYFCDRVVIMYLGRVVEISPSNLAAGTPRHPYTKALMDSIFTADPEARKDSAPIEGEVPSPFNLPPGCVFESRCPFAAEKCRAEQPALVEAGPGEFVALSLPPGSDLNGRIGPEGPGVAPAPTSMTAMPPRSIQDLRGSARLQIPKGVLCGGRDILKAKKFTKNPSFRLCFIHFTYQWLLNTCFFFFLNVLFCFWVRSKV